MFQVYFQVFMIPNVSPVYLNFKEFYVSRDTCTKPEGKMLWISTIIALSSFCEPLGLNFNSETQAIYSKEE